MTQVITLGANARILTSTSLPIPPTTSNPALVVYYEDIKQDNWQNPSTADLDPWIFAIIQKLYSYNLNATNENHNIVVSSRFFGIGTRNSIPNRLTESYSVTTFGAAIGNGVDPDDL